MLRRSGFRVRGNGILGIRDSPNFMTLSKKLAQQQLLRTRNEARFSSLSVATVDESASSLPLSDPSTIQSSLEKLRRKIRKDQPDQEQSSGSVSDQRDETFGGVLEGRGNGAFLRCVSHSPFGFDDQQEEECGGGVED